MVVGVVVVELIKKGEKTLLRGWSLSLSSPLCYVKVAGVVMVAVLKVNK